MHVTAVRAGACCKGPLAGSGGPFASPDIPRRVLSDCNGSNALHAGAWLLHDMQVVEALLRRSAGGQAAPQAQHAGGCVQVVTAQRLLPAGGVAPQILKRRYWGSCAGDVFMAQACRQEHIAARLRPQPPKLAACVVVLDAVPGHEFAATPATGPAWQPWCQHPAHGLADQTYLFLLVSPGLKAVPAGSLQALATSSNLSVPRWGAAEQPTSLPAGALALCQHRAVHAEGCLQLLGAVLKLQPPPDTFPCR